MMATFVWFMMGVTLCIAFIFIFILLCSLPFIIYFDFKHSRDRKIIYTNDDEDIGL